MRLSQMLSPVLAETPLTVSVPDESDLSLILPDALTSVEAHQLIVNIVADACRSAGLSERGAHVFGEFVADLLADLSTRLFNANEWDALSEHLSDALSGVCCSI